jgi:hypothetical protein
MTVIDPHTSQHDVAGKRSRRFGITLEQPTLAVFLN